MKTVRFDILSLDDLTTYAKLISDHLTAPMIIGLKGDMGSGKTTFVRSLCDALNSTDWVNSPTYSIIQEYASPKFKIIHIDLYRLTSDASIDQLDIENSITSNSIAFIEWIDRTSIIPIDALIELTVLSPDHRVLSLSSSEKLKPLFK